MLKNQTRRKLYHLDVTGGALTFTFVLDPEAMIAGLFVTKA
jgi:hypothetical protein